MTDLDTELEAPEDPVDLWLAGYRSAYRTPEQRLLLAVLERALTDTKLPPRFPKYRRMRDDALAWLRDTEDSGPYSAASACDALGLSVDALRRGLACYS